MLKIKRAYRRPKSEISSFGFRRYALWFINYAKIVNFDWKDKALLKFLPIKNKSDNRVKRIRPNHAVFIIVQINGLVHI